MKRTFILALLLCLWVAPLYAAETGDNGIEPATESIQAAGSENTDFAKEDAELIFARIFAGHLEKAETGDADAMVAVGLCYINAEGVAEDSAKAMEWFQKAAKLNNSSAQYFIGKMYYEGNGVKRDYDEAFAWFQKSAAQNDPKGYTGLGLAYYRGRAVKRDYALAQEYFSRAAEMGYAEAKAHLALMYYNGQGVKKDQKKAFELNLQAAEGGSTLAQYSLSKMYYRGKGVKKDMIEAYKWISVSRFMGNDSEDAMEHMNMVSKWLSSPDFDIAKDRASQWLNDHGVIRRAPLLKFRWF